MLVFSLHPKMQKFIFREAIGLANWKDNSGTVSPTLRHACGEKITFLGLADALCSFYRSLNFSLYEPNHLSF